MLTPKPTFRDVVRRYHDEQVVFSSPERGALYWIASVDDTGVSVDRLSAKESVRVTYSSHDERMADLRQAGAPREKAFLGSAVANIVTLLQSPELALSADRRTIVDLPDEETGLALFCSLVRRLSVHRSDGAPKLYKPALLAVLIEAIGDGTVKDHRIEFDTLLPRFLAKMQSLGESVTPEQAAMPFFHLSREPFWNLAYRNVHDLLDSGNITPSSIRQKVSHAVLKEPFRWLLEKHENRQRVLQALADQWWPESGEKAMANHWWVNQGQTFTKERDAGILWAPQANKNGKSQFHWHNVGKVQADDIVFHYANGSLVAVSKCTRAGEKGTKPKLWGENWQEEGWLAHTSYAELASPIPLASIARPIRKLNIEYGPINKTERVNQGYLFALPPTAARIIAEQIDLRQLPDEIASSLQQLIGDQWDAFVDWAKRIWEDPSIREGERSYKLKCGELLTSSHRALKESGDWFTPLRRAFQGNNRLTNYRSHNTLLKWCQKDTEAAKRLLLAVWKPETPDADAVAAGLALLPTDIIQGKGTRNNLVSFIAMGRDTTRCPIYKSEPFEAGCRITGYPSFFDLDESEYYDHALGFLDRIISEAGTRGLELHDRLDAQCALWCVTKYEPPNHWPKEGQQAFLDFQAGTEQEMEDNDDGPTERTTGHSLEELAQRLYLDVDFLEELALLIESKRQIIFYGPPGTGKTYVAKALAKHLAGRHGQVEIVQFHPSYAYEDFVEGFRPHLENGQSGFRLSRGPLRRLAAKAKKHPTSTFVLLIDEINRGNVAKIFGELYFLLEYRDEDISLQYSRKRFSLPPNLWVIGTMNTTDRSIALIDAALRRRFYFIPFFPDEAPVSDVLRRWLDDRKPELAWVADVVDAANTKLGNRHAAIGPSYFMRSDLDENWLRLIWKHAITPYLAEQFFGDEEQVKEFELEKLRDALAGESSEP